MGSPERDELVADVLRVSPDLAVRAAEAVDALRSEVERQAGIIAALDRTVEELSAALDNYGCAPVLSDGRTLDDLQKGHDHG